MSSWANLPTVQLSDPAAPEDEEGVLGRLRFAPLTTTRSGPGPGVPYGVALRGTRPCGTSKKVKWQDDGEALRARCGVWCGPRACGVA